MGLPFNGDFMIENEFDKLVKKYNIQTIIETGTWKGHTTKFFAKIVPAVMTIEIDRAQAPDNAHLRLLGNVMMFDGNSPKVLPYAVAAGKPPFMFYLDAHWYTYNPLPDELKTIAMLDLKPVIVIHDFKVPNTNLGYDCYDKQEYTIEWIKPMLDAVYGDNKYSYHYNDPATAQGARRGVIFIEPK